MADFPSDPLHPEYGGIWMTTDQEPPLHYPMSNFSFLQPERVSSAVGRDMQMEERSPPSFLRFLNKLPPPSLTDHISHLPHSSALSFPTTNSPSRMMIQNTTDSTQPTTSSTPVVAHMPPHRKKTAANKKDEVVESDPWTVVQNSGQYRAPMGWATVITTPEEPSWQPDLATERATFNQKPNTPLQPRGRRGRGNGRGGQASGTRPTVRASKQGECQDPVRLAKSPKIPTGDFDVPLHSANRGRNNQRRGNARGRGRARFATKSDRWAKVVEIDKSRWDIHWDSDSASRSMTTVVSSYWANAGRVYSTRKLAKGAGYEIGGYDGKWAPAPIDWDSRPAFRESQSENLIEAWLDKNFSELRGYSHATSLETHRSLDGHLAPRYWIPKTIDNKSWSNFWHDMVTSDEPAPEDYGDLNGVKPWWLTYKSSQTECEMIEPYQHKWEEVGIDPEDENQFEKAARARDTGSANATVRRKNLEKAKKERKRRQQELQEQRDDKYLVDAELPLRIKSDLELSIRTASNDDLDAVCEIYNHYVEFTTCVSEIEKLSTAMWKDRLEKAFAKKLPFLVAYKKGDRIPPPKRKPNADAIIIPDTLVGFAYAKDLDISEQPNAYESTIEIAVYTHSMYLMKGVARCLVDQLLGQIDLNYSPAPRSIFTPEWDPEIDEFLPGSLPLIGRKIKNVLVSLPYERPERMKRVGGWLSRAFDFEKKGVLSGIGMKNEKTINLALFQRPCNSETVQESCLKQGEGSNDNI